MQRAAYPNTPRDAGTCASLPRRLNSLFEGAVLPSKDFRKIQEEREELESILAYDAAKASGDEVIPFQQAVSEIERSGQ